jgi:hypothetical protein
MNGKLLKTFAAAAFLFLGVLDARAQSGNELSQQCLTNNRSLIFGYIEGVLDKADVDTDVLFHFYFDTYDGPKTAERIEKDNQAIIRSFLAVDGYCIPKEATFEQKADVFCKYLLENPDQRAKNAAELVGSALRAAWPCK